MGVAVDRGCQYYDSNFPSVKVPLAKFSSEELIIYLILNSHPYTPTAIRIAAMLLGSKSIDYKKLFTIAKKERTERTLSYIIECAQKHADNALSNLAPLVESNLTSEVLPHWSRFILLSGVDRNGQKIPSKWLVPQE